MGWTPTYHLLPLLATAAISLALLVIAWQNRVKQGAKPLLVILVGVVGWTSVLIVQIASNDPALLNDGDLVKFLFMPLTAIGWYAFAATYTNNRQYLSRPALVALLSVPVGTFLVVITHALGGPQLLYNALETHTVTVLGGQELLLANSDRGVWFVVHAAHTYVFVFVGSYLLVRSAIGTWSVYRSQAIVMLIAVAAPVTGNVLRLARVTAIDFTPFGFGLSAIAVSWGLFRYELLDLVPIARETVIAEMRDAVIVLDAQDRIVDANDAATPLVGSVDSAIGRPASDVLPFDPGSYTTGGGWQELALGTDDGTVHYRLEATAIRGRSDRQTGTLLVLQDITEMKRRERELEETTEELEILNRVVRHDIRNDMNVVAGHAQVLEERIDDETLESHIEPVRHNSEHAIELTRTVRDLLESITGDSEFDLEAVDLERTIEEEIEKARETYSAAVVEFDRPEERTRVPANSMLSSVFKNLLSNAVRHNDTEEPRIEVSTVLEDDHVRVRVADNGPGVPDDQKDDVFGRGEKGLDSPGTGIGLYLVDTLVSGYGGSVWIEDNDPRGAVFVVELPIADRPEAADRRAADSPFAP